MDHVRLMRTGEPFLLGLAVLGAVSVPVVAGLGTAGSWVAAHPLVAGVSSAGGAVVAHPPYKQYLGSLWPWSNSANRSELQQPFSVKEIFA